jgi:hypothetical protein
MVTEQPLSGLIKLDRELALLVEKTASSKTFA